MRGKRVALGLLGLAMALVPAPSAMANSMIIGQAGVAGADMYSATGITFLNPGLVFLANGALSPLDGVSINVKDFNFTGVRGVALFDTTGYDFTIGTVDVLLNNQNFLNVSGTGTLTLNGMNATPYIFHLSSNRTADDFFTYGLTIAPTSAVPEPASLLLLGSGLLGLAGLLFRRARKSRSTVSTHSAVPC